MSDKLGPLTFGKKDEAIFLGKELATHKDYSEKTAVMIDEEIKNIVLSCYKKAKNILEQHRDIVDKTAKLLLEKETIDSNQIDALLNGTNGEIVNDEINNS